MRIFVSESWIIVIVLEPQHVGVDCIFMMK